MPRFLLVLCLLIFSIPHAAIAYEVGENEPEESAGFIWTKYVAERADTPATYHAQFHLCDMYLQGKETPRNVDEGLKWCERASENGVEESSLYLGGLYMHVGNNDFSDVPKDYKKAAYYFERYATQQPENKEIYGLMAALYDEGGYGLEKDEGKAASYKKIYDEYKADEKK